MLIRLALLLSVSAVSLPVRSQSLTDETFLKEGRETAFQNGSNVSGQKTTGTRYFLSTNVVNIALLSGNLALEVRFPNNFALKGSIFGSPSAFAYRSRGYRSKVIGFHPEARWYINRSKSLYVGMSGNLLHIADYKRDFNSETRKYVGGWHNTCNTTIASLGGVIGYYLRLGYRFGIDFNTGIGLNYISSLRTVIPFVIQHGISLSWEVGKNPPPRKN